MKLAPGGKLGTFALVKVPAGKYADPPSCQPFAPFFQNPAPVGQPARLDEKQLSVPLTSPTKESETTVVSGRVRLPVTPFV